MQNDLTPLAHVLTYKPSGAKRMCSVTPDGKVTCNDYEPERYDRKVWLQLLLDHGADVNRQSHGTPPLLLTQEGDMESIQLLANYGAKMSGPFGKLNLFGQERTLAL